MLALIAFCASFATASSLEACDTQNERSLLTTKKTLARAAANVTEPNSCSTSPCSSCLVRADSDACKWKFKKYIPSELEAKWWDVVEKVQDNPCEAVLSSTFSEYFTKYKAAIERGLLANDKPAPGEVKCSCDKGAKAVAFDATVFSRFEYENECSGETTYSYIEPLAGVLRHPGVCDAPAGSDSIEESVLRKDWLLVDQWELHKNRDMNSRFFYFDAGASTWSTGAGGASQSWFDSIYVDMCAPFQGYWMWEVTNVDPTAVFQDMPARVKPNYHWYNIPASPNKDSSDSPLYHLRSSARPDDYVVMKIDIDNNAVEEEMVEALLHDPYLQSLVDEFYWEHHIQMSPMVHWWGSAVSKSHKQKESIAMFRQLREAGVRAHSWV